MAFVVYNVLHGIHHGYFKKHQLKHISTMDFAPTSVGYKGFKMSP